MIFLAQSSEKKHIGIGTYKNSNFCISIDKIFFLRIPLLCDQRKFKCQIQLELGIKLCLHSAYDVSVLLQI